MKVYECRDILGWNYTIVTSVIRESPNIHKDMLETCHLKVCSKFRLYDLMTVCGVNAITNKEFGLLFIDQINLLLWCDISYEQLRPDTIDFGILHQHYFLCRAAVAVVTVSMIFEKCPKWHCNNLRSIVSCCFYQIC